MASRNLWLVCSGLIAVLCSCSGQDPVVGRRVVHAAESLLPHVVDSTNVITVSGHPSCPSCAIRFDTVAVLGGHDSISVTQSAVLAGATRDGYMVAPIGDYAELGQYSAHGRLVSIAGREGDGPGEFSNIRWLSLDTDDDSVVILDRRLTVLSPTLSFVVTRPLPSKVSASRVLSLPNGRLLVNNYGPGNAALCLFTRSLELDRCFGPRPERMDYRRDDMQFNLAVSPRGGIITVPLNAAYAIEYWTAEGQPERTYTVTDSPLNDQTRDRRLPEVSPRVQRPSPRILGVHQDTLGRIWIAGMIADDHWKADANASARGGGESAVAPLLVSDYGRYFDGIVEVLDLASERLIVRARVPEPISGITPDGYMWQYALTADGDLQMVVLKPYISQSKPKED